VFVVQSKMRRAQRLLLKLETLISRSVVGLFCLLRPTILWYRRIDYYELHYSTLEAIRQW